MWICSYYTEFTWANLLSLKTEELGKVSTENRAHVRGGSVRWLEPKERVDGVGGDVDCY